MHTMYGTIKRAGFTVFLCFLRTANGPTLVSGEGETECIGPKARDGFGKNCIDFIKEACWWKVEHVKSVSKDEEQQMSLDEPATDGATMVGGEMAQIRSSTVQHRREGVYPAVQYAASFHCVLQEWHNCEELKHKPKEKFRGQNVGSQEASYRVVCSCKEIPLHEVWEEHYNCENDRDMRRSKVAGEGHQPHAEKIRRSAVTTW